MRIAHAQMRTARASDSAQVCHDAHCRVRNRDRTVAEPHGLAERRSSLLSIGVRLLVRALPLDLRSDSRGAFPGEHPYGRLPIFHVFVPGGGSVCHPRCGRVVVLSGSRRRHDSSARRAITIAAKEVFMTLCLEQEMHATHREWMSENALRRSEARNWQYEFYQLQNELPKLQVAIACHAVTLAEHAAGVRDYDVQLAEQEHVLAADVAAHHESLPELATRIALEESDHLHQAECHDLLKLHHYEVLKHWRALMKALDHCEFPPQG
jgi:hypothetical protein